MSAEKPVSVSRGTLETVSVYLHDDRLEIGRANGFGVEQLRRAVYRDATRLVVWRDARRITRVIGIVLLVGALLGAAIAVASSDLAAQIVVGWFSGLAGLIGLWGLWSGRPGALTRFRVEVRRGHHVDGVLVGRARTRDAVVADIARRIRERQSRADPD